ncbi:MAG: glutamate mutase L [Chloroflexota bacterium]
MTSLLDADSFLVVDVGTVNTRAVLFDVVEGRYRFVASGTAPSTAKAPFNNVGEGVRLALDRLQTITGRTLIGADEQLIIPSAPDGSGIDRFAATLSAGEPLKVVVVGLLEDISLESARRLAASTYANVQGAFSLNDRRRTDTRINLLLRQRPDLIIAAGGTQGGASQSVIQMLEAVGLYGYLTGSSGRPELLFAGNDSLKDEIQESLGPVTNLHFAPNLRPDLETEQIEGARAEMARMYTQVRAKQIPGVDELNRWAGGGLLPTASAFGRIVRIQSKTHATRKGVLGIDLGAGAISVAAAYDGSLSLNVFPQYGMGSPVYESDPGALEAISSWLALDMPLDDLRDYLYNKALLPDSLPATAEEMAIEQALARYLMRSALKAAAPGFPAAAQPLATGLLPAFEPIIAAGGVLAGAPNVAHSTLMMLDGIQPTGITTMVLDQHNMVSALGAAAAQNPTLVVQVLDSNSLLHIGTVIAPLARVRSGEPVLRLKIVYESGYEASLEVKQGSLEMLPLPAGQMAKLQLQPLHRADIGMGAPGRGGGLRVMGGVLGVIIDARGRPLNLPADRGRRAELYKKWLWNLGGQ